jgi:serine/threonine protein kinase/tetratricopeptide (TPR) repeat protein
MNTSTHLLHLCLDQQKCWQRGERVVVEDYLDREPTLANNPEAALDLIYNEILLREKHGEPPHLEEYLSRFPKFSRQLKLQFDVHRALDEQRFTQLTEKGQSGARVAAATSTSIGQMLRSQSGNSYAILGELGRGGMGVVYHARHVELKRDVALKMVLAGIHADENEIERFRIEAEAIARLQHPNIVQVYEIGSHDGCPYLALEYVNGPSLQDLLARCKPSMKSTARLVETLARAMHHAHERAIVHRDLKPANILLAPDQNFISQAGARQEWSFETNSWMPKITDFGLAKVLDSEGKQSVSAAFLGTPSYMAPEQAVGNSRTLDRRADIYALGAILYELLTGQPPFQAASMLETLAQVRSEEPVSPARIKSAVPRDLETICLKCLTKNPDRRYATALELAEDLRRFIASEPIQARPANFIQRTSKWIKRRPMTASLIAVLGLGGIMFAVSWLSSRHQTLLDVAGAHARFVDFCEKRDQALGDIYAETFIHKRDSATVVDQVRQEVLRAFRLMEEPDENAAPRPDPLWTDAEKAEAQLGCAELLIGLGKMLMLPIPHEAETARVQRIKQALAMLDFAARIAPFTKSWQSWCLRRAECERALGNQEQASAELTPASTTNPAGLMDSFLLGQDLVRNHPEKAIANLQAARGLQNNCWPALFLGYALVRTGRAAEAEKVLSQVPAQGPALVYGLLLHAQASQALGQFRGAESDYQKALQQNLDEDAQYALDVGRACLFFAKKDLDAAALDFKRAIALKPAHYQAHLGLAQVYSRQGHEDLAANEFAEAIRLQPPTLSLGMEPLLWRGINLTRERRFEQAVQACDEALRLQPEAAIPHGLKARALLALGRYTDAVESFNRYEQKGGPLVTDLYRGRGQARMQLHDYLGAKDDYSRALSLGASYDLYLHRGWAYFFADALQPAAKDFSKARELNSAEPDPCIGLGLCEAYRNDYPGALTHARAAEQLSIRSPEMMHNLACIYSLASRSGTHDQVEYGQKAVALLRQALEHVPSSNRDAFWKKKMLPDRALDPIRHSKEFKALEKEMARRGMTFAAGSLEDMQTRSRDGL